MAGIVFTPAADADAAAIFDDLHARAGKPTVVKYRALFNKLYDNLAVFPDSGAPRARLGVEVRIAVVSPFVVIYRHARDDGKVRVLRIVHGRRKTSGSLLRGRG